MLDAWSVTTGFIVMSVTSVVLGDIVTTTRR